jgi:la-related protein 1
MSETSIHPIPLPALFPIPTLQIRPHFFEERLPPPNRSRYASDESLDCQNSSVRNWSTIFDRGPEFFLPAAVLSEITEDASAAPTLTGFEECIARGDTEGARAQLLEQLGKQGNEFETGKLLRAAGESAKRAGSINLSASIYEMATMQDPTTLASWVDRAKLHDELGETDMAERVLEEGIHKSRSPDQLLRKMLRSMEKAGDLARARTYLGHIRETGVSDPEGLLLTEGGLFELRQGNVAHAMAILNFVKHEYGWKPSTYTEVIQLFDRTGKIQTITGIVEEAGASNPRNAMVCEARFKVQNSAEAMVNLFRNTRSRWTCEFQDKMTASLCESLARRGELSLARRILSQGVFRCSTSQKYKLLMAAGLIELVYGDSSLSPLLLHFARAVTPLRSRSAVMILTAKVFELGGNFDDALKLYESAVREFGSSEWRTWFDLAQFHLHRSDSASAQAVLAAAMQYHSGSGRLWALRIQVQVWSGIESQISVFREAIKSVPKSGEVWCEAARLCMNPLSEYFNLDAAKQYLDLAHKFTPQHGDTLVELVRLELLTKGHGANFGEIRRKFIASDGNYGLSYTCLRGFDERPVSERLPDIIREVAKDLEKHRRVYARAIARSSFVPKSLVDAKRKLVAARCDGSVTDFAFGLTPLAKWIQNPDKCENYGQKLTVVFGTIPSSQ